MSDSPQTNKDRDLSKLDFLDNLQLEYFINEIRSRIYPSPNDKRYYKKVMNFKKEKIIDVAAENSLDCIFTSDDLHAEVKSLVYPENGFPHFKSVSEQDIDFYYLEGSDVRVKIEENNRVGKIEKGNLKKKIIYVKLRGEKETKQFSAEVVTRIL